MGWKIDNWERFEPPKQNDRDQTGELKYWKCPVSQNRRYKLLTMSGPRGWEMLGIWHAIVTSWGRQTRESRKGGVLRTALAGNNPASLKELASDTLVPQAKLKPASAKLLEIGWLELESGCNTNGSQMDNPNGIQTDSETRLDETRLDETRQEEKPPVPKFTYRHNVKLTRVEYDKLLAELGDQGRLDCWLDKLSGYKASKGKSYKSDYATWGSWGKAWWQREGSSMFGTKPQTQKEDGKIAILDTVAAKLNTPDHIKAKVASLIALYPRWAVNENILGFWCDRMKILDGPRSKRVLDIVLNKSGDWEPEKKILNKAISDTKGG